MAENLVSLAECFVRLSGELDATRRAMLACLSNGLDHDEASAPAKPNGLDLYPPPGARTDMEPRSIVEPGPTKARPAKTRRHVTKFNERTAEQRLLTAMGANPGLTVVALANACNAGRSATGERLRQLAERGVVEKSATGRWRLKDGPQGPPPAGEEAGRPPMQPPAG